MLMRMPESWVDANADQIVGILRPGRALRFSPAIRSRHGTRTLGSRCLFSSLCSVMSTRRKRAGTLESDLSANA